MEKAPLINSTTVRQKPTFFNYCWYYFELTRLHKGSLGNQLVVWPALWPLTMAAYTARMDPFDLLTHTAAFTFGGYLTHSAACVINDICDIDFDRQVERCKNRPLAAGVISVTGAWILLLTMTAALVGLMYQMNTMAFYVGLLGIFPWHALYPLMKRVTYWPQAWLGIAMNWGVPVAWLSVMSNYGDIDVRIMSVLLVGTLCWTLVYDTEYACQDRKDDAKAGVKSTALLFGDNVKIFLAGFATVFMWSLLYAGMLNQQSMAYYVISCGGAALHFIWQFVSWDINNPADCGAKFKANHDLGYIIYAGLVVDYVLRMRA